MAAEGRYSPPVMPRMPQSVNGAAAGWPRKESIVMELIKNA